jgi:hypothetical protein
MGKPKSFKPMNILIISYSRYEGLKRLLDSVLHFDSEANIFVSIDGAGNNKILEIQNQMRELLDSHLGLGSRLQYQFLEENNGVAAGVIKAIDWFFAQVESGIILEDDLVVADGFFHYCTQSLSDFEHEVDVWMISGSQIFESLDFHGHLQFANYPMIWGWATWRSKWQEMRELLLRPKQIALKNIFNQRYLFWAVGANRALTGLVDTWDTPLAFEFFNNRKLCVIPPVNLVSNVGDDDFAAHTKNSGFPLFVPLQDFKGYQLGDMNQIYSRSKDYNSILETNLFRIRARHIFIPYYSFLLDRFHYPEKNRKIKLADRLAEN